MRAIKLLTLTLSVTALVMGIVALVLTSKEEEY